MRALLSAYACEPGRGSEPEVGWQRALHMLSYANEVWVLTRANNRAVIESDPLSNSKGLHFLYYDLPAWALRLKKKAWFIYFYCILWQWGAYRLAARYHRDKPFDCVYHVTFASMQYGSFMGLLRVPLIVGPIAGGERAPLRLRRSMPLRGKASELLRDLGILVQPYNPLARIAFAAAKRIFVATPDSLRLIATKWRSKTSVHLAVATRDLAVHARTHCPPASPRFVFAGNLLYLKGIHFAIRAMAITRTVIPDATLTIIGNGPAEQWLRKTATDCRLNSAIRFVGQIHRDLLIQSFEYYTALLFPSLNDTGGMVVLEALSRGLPVISLNLGGPGIIVNNECGILVPMEDADEIQTVKGLAYAMITMARMPDSKYSRLVSGAIARANELSWTNLTAHIAE